MFDVHSWVCWAVGLRKSKWGSKLSNGYLSLRIMIKETTLEKTAILPSLTQPAKQDDIDNAEKADIKEKKKPLNINLISLGKCSKDHGRNATSPNCGPAI